MNEQYEVIIYEKQDEVAYITLNRPKFLNAYNIRMRDELYEALGAIKDDPDIRVTIIKGAGDRAFCAGADLTEFLTAPSPVIARQVRWERDIWGRFLSITKPFIVALHGYVLGSGIEIALCGDIRIASEDAQFGLPEIGLGIIPAAGGTQTLPRTMLKGPAMEALLTGRRFSAQEAYRYRMVNRVVPRSELLDTAENMARRISAFDPRVIAGAKTAVNQAMDLTLSQGIELENRLKRRLAGVE